MSDKDDIKVGVGGEVNDSYRDSIKEASELVKEVTAAWNGVQSKLTAITGVTNAALGFMGRNIAYIYDGLGYVLLKLELIHLLFKAFAANTKEAGDGLKEFANVEDMETQFKSILRSATDAKQRVMELRALAQGSPFKLEDVGGASKTLELMTQGQLSSGSGLQSVMDVAAKTGAPLREVADGVGRLYQVIQAGEPLGRAARELEQFGIMTEQERLDLERLQASGKSAGDVWTEFAKRSLNAAGATATQAQTLQTLNDKLKEAQDEMGREVGEVYAQDAKDSAKATTDLTQTMTPLTVEATKLKEAFGMARMPTQTFPFFDKQIKGFMTMIFQAKGAWTDLIDVMGAVGPGIFVGVIAKAIQFMWGYANSAWQATKATIKWAEAEEAAGKAGIGARAVLLSQAAAAKTYKFIIKDLLMDLTQMAKAAVSPLGLLVALLSAIYIYAEKRLAQIEAMKELYTTTMQAVGQMQAERDAIVTVTDKVTALTNQYQKLAEAKQRIMDATDPMMLTLAQQSYIAIVRQVRKTEGVPDGAPSAERQRIMDQMGDLQEKQLDRDLSVQEQLIHLENEKAQLVAKRAELEKTAADAAKRVSPATLSAMWAELSATRTELAQSQARVAKAKEEGGMFGEGWAQTNEQPLQDRLNGKISAIEGQIASNPQAIQASENAQTDLATNSLQASTIDDKTAELRKRETRESYGAAEREAEAATERDILELKTRGVQKTVDEAKLRQSLAAQKLADMQADQQRLVVQEGITKQLEEQAQAKLAGLTSTGTQRLTDEKTIRDQLAVDLENAAQQGGVLFTKDEQRAGILAAQNEFLEQQRTINEAILSQEDEKLNREGKKLSRLESMVSKLPKFMQKPFLQQELTMSDKEASDLQARAEQARKVGDISGADEFQNRADEARDHSAELRDELKVWADTPLTATVDAQQKLGEGGRIAHGTSSHMMVGTENKLQQIIDILKTKGIPSSSNTSRATGATDLPFDQKVDIG